MRIFFVVGVFSLGAFASTGECPRKLLQAYESQVEFDAFRKILNRSVSESVTESSPDSFTESNGVTKLTLGGMTLSVQQLNKDVGIAHFTIAAPPFDSNNRFGGNSGGEGGGQGGPDYDESKNPESQPSEKSENSLSAPEAPKSKETLKQCASRNVLLFGMSSVANLIGSYSAFKTEKWPEDLPWYQASIVWMGKTTMNGVAKPSDYGHAFKSSGEFRQNNVWNAVLMGVLSGAECTMGKEKAKALVTSVALLSSMAGQMMTQGRVSFANTVLDVAFIRYLTIPRARLGGYFDRRFFQKHVGVRRMTEVSSYYLMDQWLGGYGYGVYLKGTNFLWNDEADLRLYSRDIFDWAVN